MRKTILTLVLVIGLLLPLKASSQGTTYISNLDQTPTGSLLVGSDSWIAQGFDLLTTDPNVYLLDSVELMLATASGNPSEFTVSVYSSPRGSSGGPQTNLGDLSGSPNPLAGGVYMYTATNITISSAEVYAVVVTAATPISQGAYRWSMVEGGMTDGTWGIANGYATSSDGSTWMGHPRQGAMQLAINATLIPEPTSLTLAGLGLASLLLWRRKPSVHGRSK